MDVVHVFLHCFPALFMVCLSWVLRRWPPSEFNQAYGYRTRRSLESPEAWTYAQRRSTELMRRWTWWMAIWTPLVGWRWGIESGILITHGLMTFGVLLPLFCVERELKAGFPYTENGGVSVWAWGFTAFLLCSVFMPITHSGSEPEREVKGTLESLTWSTRSEDVFLRIRGDECGYYINRGLGMGVDTLAWKSHLVGRELILQVVNRPAGLNWFGAVGPVRGVILGQDTIYRTGVVRNP